MSRTLSTWRDGLLICAVCVMAALGGCASDEATGGPALEASDGELRVSVSIPDDEAASIGTYVLTVDSSSGDDARSQITGEREGTVTGLWVDDLTDDGHSDVVVAMTSAGSGSYGVCHVYSGGGDGFARVELAPLTEEQVDGFMGHDAFSVVDGALLRTFPVYAAGDANARPSGGILGYRYDFEAGKWVAP